MPSFMESGNTYTVLASNKRKAKRLVVAHIKKFWKDEPEIMKDTLQELHQYEMERTSPNVVIQYDNDD